MRLLPNVIKLKIKTMSQTVLSYFFFDIVWLTWNALSDIWNIAFYRLTMLWNYLYEDIWQQSHQNCCHLLLKVLKVRALLISVFWEGEGPEGNPVDQLWYAEVIRLPGNLNSFFGSPKRQFVRKVYFSNFSCWFLRQHMHDIISLEYHAFNSQKMEDKYVHDNNTYW